MSYICFLEFTLILFCNARSRNRIYGTFFCPLLEHPWDRPSSDMQYTAPTWELEPGEEGKTSSLISVSKYCASIWLYLSVLCDVHANVKKVIIQHHQVKLQIKTYKICHICAHIAPPKSVNMLHFTRITQACHPKGLCGYTL